MYKDLLQYENKAEPGGWRVTPATEWKLEHICANGALRGVRIHVMGQGYGTIDNSYKDSIVIRPDPECKSPCPTYLDHCENPDITYYFTQGFIDYYNLE